MDFLKRCGGSNFCHFTKIIQKACFGALAYKGLLPSTLNDARTFIVRPTKRLVTHRHLRRVVVSYSKSCSSISSRIDHRNRRTNGLPTIVDEYLNELSNDIKTAMNASSIETLQTLTDFCFLDGGKLTRPTVVLLMAGCCCSTKSRTVNTILPNQRKIAVISEMIHTASLIHDDIIDESDQRRGRPTVSSLAGNKAAVLIGDYILAKATQLLTTVGNSDVISLLAQVIEDLVKGEFMQLGSRSTEDERFSHYMQKTFKKTASLFAHSCRAVALLSDCSETIKDAAFEYGRNLGLAFQLIDDMLDFVAKASLLGKPAFADLRLGIATAPVLFASRQHPELNELILRRFSKAGDVEKAWHLVLKSDGISRCKEMAGQYCQDATRSLKDFPDSQFKNALVDIATKQSTRER